jgi:hypothetical protein
MTGLLHRKIKSCATENHELKPASADYPFDRMVQTVLSQRIFWSRNFNVQTKMLLSFLSFTL